MKKIKKFLKDKSGATAITFGLLLVPLLGATSLAISYNNASNQRSDLQNAADAAVLWGASTYKGNNLDDVKVRIQKSLHANIPDFDSSSVTYNVTVTEDVPARIKLAVARPLRTAFMQVLNQSSTTISATSTASGALTPEEASIQVTNVKGTYYKKISIIVVAADGKQQEMGSVEYTYVNGVGTANPKIGSAPMTFKLGTYNSFYFTMIVKKDGCPIGTAPKYILFKGDICSATNDPSAQLTPMPDNLTFNQEKAFKASAKAFLVRSDRANDAWRFVADGGQSTKEEEKAPILMNDLMNCKGLTQKHGWEDGGGGTPDFEYTLKTGCTYDYSKVRLTQ
ncbi:Tad domain-containing protein [Phyllobacterium myrsinacearum]|uniref:Flp pilus assembly protein TadG n=1 Tax=Phyllobacterium myrsinacearum TaxID=28101 RepID=A0A839EGM2_9HYPH|nr:TadE/TadG family type IV pilus assembly protein [Phyllobacterium myrsinacearum]MBA8877445.1 Flp pilus assembly protein TadG [Phyllobacterium myrsinacearum]